MTSVFPNAIQDFDLTRWTSWDSLWEDWKNHITHHQNEDDTLLALQTKIWIDNSVDKTSFDYKLNKWWQDISIPDWANHTWLAITNNDTTNNPNTLVVSNNTNWDSFKINTDDLVVKSNGKVWISVDNPRALLQVWNEDIDSSLFLVWTINWANSSILRLLEGDNEYRWWYIKYNWNTNKMSIWMHEAWNETLTDDVDTITIQRSNRYIWIWTDSPTGVLDINANSIRLRTAKTPASATATWNQWDICWDSNYLYVCIATNTWKRMALSTW